MTVCVNNKIKGKIENIVFAASDITTIALAVVCLLSSIK